eukprot:Tbor_TRINITY_DN5664_c0_g2::TRINITY_DN5664_c0_g2_i1::g.8829::m.8829
MSFSYISYIKVSPFVALLMLTLASAEETSHVYKDISCKRLENNELTCALDSTNPMGSIDFNKSLKSTGWDTLNMKINPKNKYLSPTEEMFAIGWAEGFVTFESISDNYKNTMTSTKLSSNVTEWINEHINYMKGLADGEGPYSVQLARLLQQLMGIASGYNQSCKASKDFICTPLDFFDIFLLNFQTEVGDVQDAFSVNSEKTEAAINNREHCSALIKPVKDDIFVSHVTWSGFTTMYRQYKTYNFGAQFITMSGYPGVIHSIDDWYMTGARLVVMETTNGVYDNTLFKKFLKDNIMVVSSFLRTMIANYLAQTPKEWVDIWSRYPSGTYNNQWMVFDMKQYTPNEKCPKGSFYIVETVPGTVKSGDMTDVLNDQGYWGSYNLPYFKEIRDLSGVTKLEEDTGNFFSYTKYARAQIFKRNHTSVTDMASMMDLMRYNNYKHDNLSLITNCTAAKGGKCNPPYSAMLAIASRGDLNPAVPPGTNPADMYGVNWKFLTQRPHCGTDAKIASYKGMMKQGKGPTDVFTATVVSGPTTSNGLPPFDHDTSPFAAEPWYGLPTGQWTFPDIVMHVSVPQLPAENFHDVSAIGIGIVSVGGFIVFLTISILIFTAVVKEKEHEELI